MVDLERVRDSFFTIFFRIMLSGVGIILSMGLIGFIFHFLKIDIASNFGWMMVFGMLIVVALIILRLKYFRDIPEGWTYSEYKEKMKIDSISEGGFWRDSFNRKFCIVVFGSCCVLVTLGVLLNNSSFVVAIPQILVIGFLVLCSVLIYRENKGKKRKSRVQLKNEYAVYQASYESKYGAHLARKVFLKLGVVMLVVVVVMILMVV